MKFKGLILAGGTGSRLRPLTDYMPKALVPLAMQPLITYPIKKLKQAGINDVGIIVSPQYLDRFKMIIGDGSIYGMKFTYIIQDEPLGMTAAIETAQDFIAGSPVVVLTADNVFDGKLNPKMGKSQIFTTTVSEEAAKSLGVAKFSNLGNLSEIVEKSDTPPSDQAVIGAYVFTDGKVLIERCKKVQPSARGEREITDLLNLYIKDSGLTVNKLEGYWSDVGTMVAYHEAQHWAAARVMWE